VTCYFRCPSDGCPRSSAIRRLSCVLGLLVLGATVRAETVVFREGKALLPVYVAEMAAPEEKAAGEELARVLGAMAGTEWPVLTESARGGAGLYVGRTRASARDLPELKAAWDLLAPTADEVGPDGFRIRTVGNRIFVEGATPEATPYAVSWLLQRYGGVRWYAPGPLGEVIPRRDRWVLPDLQIVREPAYVSREISGLRGDAGRDWARRNGLRQRLEYSHNLMNLFTPEVYDAHPEWFGAVRGMRRRPLGGGEFRWQPDLTRPDVAEFAAAKAAEAFVRAPGRACFSLGMNDSMRFDQGAGTRAVVEPLRYFRGMPDYSPLIMTFMNRAVEALGQRPGMENRYLGCLAYFWAENPPAFPVNERVVPYVTTDRTQFYDPAYRSADYALMSRWQRSGVRAYGLWEYAEGSAFVIPRVPHAMLAEAVHAGWWRGARGYMGECGPHGGFDAFKVWMLAQLLWEPDRPLAELEDDFFVGWYGPAAPAMRRFFARCEQVWMAQPGPPWWIKFYQQQDQVLLFSPEVCADLRGILDEAESIAECGLRNADSHTDKCGKLESWNGRRMAEAGGRRTEAVTGNKVTSDRIADGGGRRSVDSGQTTEGGSRNCTTEYTESTDGGGQKTASASCLLSPDHTPRYSLLAARCFDRVRLTSRAFAVTEAAVAFDRLRRELMATEAETMGAAGVGLRLVSWQRARERLVQAVDAATAGETPALASSNIGFLLRNDPVPGLLAALARREPAAPRSALAELVTAGVAVPEQWRVLAMELGEARLKRAGNLLANGTFAETALGGHQPRFLHPRSGELPAGWDVRSVATEQGRVALGPAIAGSRALRIEGAWDTQLNQRQPVWPGRLYVAEVQMRGRSSPGNDAALTLAFVDAGGKLTGEYRVAMLPKGESAWRTLVLADVAPENAKYVVIGVLAQRQFGGDWLEATGVSLRVAE